MVTIDRTMKTSSTISTTSADTTMMGLLLVLIINGKKVPFYIFIGNKPRKQSLTQHWEGWKKVQYNYDVRKCRREMWGRFWATLQGLGAPQPFIGGDIDPPPVQANAQVICL